MLLYGRDGFGVRVICCVLLGRLTGTRIDGRETGVRGRISVCERTVLDAAFGRDGVLLETDTPF